MALQKPRRTSLDTRHGRVGVQNSSHRVRRFAIPCSMPGLPILPHLSVNPGAHSNSCSLSRDAIQPSLPLWPLLLKPSVFPSIRVFSNESVLCIKWSKYWSFSFRISPSDEWSGLISFRIDWFNLLAVQDTLKSLLQHHSLKASIL